ncbi:MAG: YtxH domain-containing protein [Bacteroidetes bacterium]|nr:MAG: YtxH domain-containing protein [Bacteroidota bacterium]
MDSGTGRIIAAFLAGAAAGASLGLLLAPERGEETRQKLKETFDDLGEKAQEAYIKAQEAYEQFTKEETGKEKAKA